MNSQEAGSAIFEKRCGTFGVKKHWNGPELELNFKVILTSTFEIFSQRSEGPMMISNQFKITCLPKKIISLKATQLLSIALYLGGDSFQF